MGKDKSSKKKDKEKDKSKRSDKDKKSGGGGHKSGDKSSGKKKHGEEKSSKNKKTEEKSKKVTDKLKHKDKEKSGKDKKNTKHSKKPVKKEKEKPKKVTSSEEDSVESKEEELEDVEEVPPPKKDHKKAKEETKKKTKNKAGHKKSKDNDEDEGEEAESKVESDEVSAESDAEEKSETESEEEVETKDSEAEEVESEPPKKAKHNDKKKHKEEKEKPSKKEPPKLEFTKPTINQMVREEERKKHPKPSLKTAEKIERTEFEAFNDEVDEMNQSVQMLHLSYGSIIKSLVAMYTKRTKKGDAKPPPTVDGKVNFLTPVSGNEEDVAADRSCLEWADKYEIDRFINPATREEAFQALFAEVKSLNKRTEKLRTKFFDKKGYFLKEKYEAQNEVKVSRKQLNEFWLWTRKLTAVIDEIARNYNDDLLNMFRLH